jgi:transposase InsO family protein
LQDKSKTQGTLKRFLRRAQNEFELKVKKIRSDNGSEFKNFQVEEYLEEEGIKHEFSAPYTPQQNGVVERKNRTPSPRRHQWAPMDMSTSTKEVSPLIKKHIGL